MSIDATINPTINETSHIDHTGEAGFPRVRLRRLRRQPRLRDLVREHRLHRDQLILPIFVKAGHGRADPIAALPGHYQWSVDRLPEYLDTVMQSQIPAVLLFGVPAIENKDSIGSIAWQENGIVQQAIRVIKRHWPDGVVMADVCCCAYTDHGHCGVLYNPSSSYLSTACPEDSGSAGVSGASCLSEVQERQNVQAFSVANDPTLAHLQRQAVSLAEAGADVIAPSGMMDGMVRAIRLALDAAQYAEVSILSYAVKYASAFYGPFREAAGGSAPQQGDRRGYQMDPGNAARALREAELDIAEGADMLMVKPAQAYLDIIYRVKTAFPALPLAAYQVSGEYAMIKAAAAQGWLDETQAMLESSLSIRRAGADMLISYFALPLARCLAEHG